MTSDQILLLGSILVPALVSVLLYSGIGRNESIVKNLAYFGFGFPFLAGIILFFFFNFDGSKSGYCFEVFHPRMGLQELKITFHLGLNGVSSPLFAMAGIVGLAAGIAAIRSGAERLRLYLALLLTMQTGLMGLFASIDLFFYYLFHEFALIPTFIMIGLWGGRDRRNIALEITIYLTLGALVSLGGLVALNVMVDAEKFDFPSFLWHFLNLLWQIRPNLRFSVFYYLGLVYLLHYFLFILGRLKGMNVLRPQFPCYTQESLKVRSLWPDSNCCTFVTRRCCCPWSPYLLWLALGNIIFVGFVTMAQSNLKSMVGYGSVMHMGYCFLGLGVCSSLGAGAGVMLMVAHGLSVSLMFLLAHYVQKRTSTFEMSSMGGLGKKTPILACFFVAATLATIGLPGFGNFWGEFGIFLSLGQNPDHYVILFLAALGIIISAIFGLRAVAKIFYGAASSELLELEKKKPISDLKSSEALPAALILLALLFIGLWPRGVADRIDQEINTRYLHFNSDYSSLPPCCLLNDSHVENNDSLGGFPTNYLESKISEN